MTKKRAKPAAADRLAGQAVGSPASGHPTGPSLNEAARLLGLSHDAVRSRVRRGTLHGEKVDGVWRVAIPNAAPHAAPVAATGRPVADQPSLRPVADRPPERPPALDVALLLAAKEQTIVALTVDLDFVRQELAARSRELADERERADTLHRLALNRIEALTAGLTERDEDGEAASEPPATRQDGLSATITPMMSDESLNNSAPPVKRTWWRRAIWGE